MRLTSLLTFLLISLFAYPQIPNIYNSRYCEEYIYNDTIGDYELSEKFCDSVEIEIDTIFNSILIIRKIDSIFSLKRNFNINFFDYDNEEELYSFFVDEIDIPEEYSREHIIYFSVPDSLVTIVLENEYSICYFLDDFNP